MGLGREIAIAKVGGGGASSWNDLKDKPFGIANTAIADGIFTITAQQGMLMAGQTNPPATPVPTLANPNEPIVCEFDGVTYELTLKQHPAFGVLCAGNFSLANALTGTDEPDTGEPFLMALYNTVALIVSADYAEVSEVSFKATAPCLTTIPVDWVPVLPYTKLDNTLYLTIDDSFTQTEWNRLATLVSNGFRGLTIQSGNSVFSNIVCLNSENNQGMYYVFWYLHQNGSLRKVESDVNTFANFKITKAIDLDALATAVT